MPKHTRSSSSTHHHHHHNHHQHHAAAAYPAAMPMAASIAPAQPVSMGYNSRPQLPLNTAAYYSVPTTAATQQQIAPQMDPQYDPYTTSAATATTTTVVPPPIPHRASSGAWSPQDDKSLLQARQQGLNWAQIQSSYFPNKTPNACRKRHERLMERKGADNWDARKFEKIAMEYSNMRQELWQPLAQKCGEKWKVVEAKCMNSGLKNVLTASRAGKRGRDDPSQTYGYDDDSGVSGILLTGADDLDAPYSSPETATSSSHSAASSFQGGYHQLHLTTQGYGHGYATGAATLSSSGYSPSVSSSSAQGYGTVPSHSHHSQSSSPYMDHGQRLPSVDMGIGAIINRPQHGGQSSNM